ncbi:hypothetical protein ACFX1R_016521 [Malus domestica]
MAMSHHKCMLSTKVINEANKVADKVENGVESRVERVGLGAIHAVDFRKLPGIRKLTSSLLCPTSTVTSMADYGPIGGAAGSGPAGSHCYRSHTRNGSDSETVGYNENDVMHNFTRHELLAHRVTKLESQQCATELGDLFVAEPISQIQTPISRPNLLPFPPILLEGHVEVADDDDLSRTKSWVSSTALGAGPGD